MAHTLAPRSALAASGIDPIQLHAQAMNALSRCKHMLLANEPMYTFALQDLEAAKQSLIALAAIEAPHAVGTTPNN